MSWLYLPAEGADYWQASGFTDGERFAMLRTKSTPSGNSGSESQTDSLTTPQSGTTCEPSTGDPGEGKSMSFRQAFLASPLAMQGKCVPPTIPETAGLIPFALLERSDQSGFFWKTSQASLPLVTDTTDEYSESWPKAGMMVSGACYRLLSWEQTISEGDSGLLPTPTKQGLNGGTNSRNAAIERGLWPTPQARDGDGRGAQGKRYVDPNRSNNLDDAVAWHEEQAGPRTGGQLNPRWVEWLMATPIGWTSLKPLETHKFQSWLRQHGIYFQEDSSEQESE